MPLNKSVILVLIILALSTVDAMLTLYIIDHGGVEANPVMLYFLNHGVIEFLIVKSVLTASCLYVLLKTRYHIMAITALSLIPFVYCALIVYEIYLIASIV